MNTNHINHDPLLDVQKKICRYFIERHGEVKCHLFLLQSFSLLISAFSMYEFDGEN